MTDYVNKMWATIANQGYGSIVPTIARSCSRSLSLNYPSNYYCNNILNHSRVYLSCCFFTSSFGVWLFYSNSIWNCYSIPLLLQLLSLSFKIHFAVFLPRFITVMLHFLRFPTHAAKYQYKMYANAKDTYPFWSRDPRSSLSVYFWFLLSASLSIVFECFETISNKKLCIYRYLYLFVSRSRFLFLVQMHEEKKRHTRRETKQKNTAHMETNNNNIHNNVNNDDENNTNNNGAIIQSKNSSN